MSAQALIERARVAAAEIAADGHNGWGNTVSDLAAALERLTQPMGASPLGWIRKEAASLISRGVRLADERISPCFDAEDGLDEPIFSAETVARLQAECDTMREDNKRLAAELAELRAQKPAFWTMKTHLQQAAKAPFLCRVHPTEDAVCTVPIYARPVPAAQPECTHDCNQGRDCTCQTNAEGCRP